MTDDLNLVDSQPEGGRSSLRPDCANCCGLCCVASAFSVSADFAIDKSPGVPCPNLSKDFRCGIHQALRDKGFPGCVAYDCFGAGQKVTQISFKGRNWRDTPEIAEPMFRVYGMMRQIHELLLYLSEALLLDSAQTFKAEIKQWIAELEMISLKSSGSLLELDVAPYRHEVNNLLLKVSAVVRARPQHQG